MIRIGYVGVNTELPTASRTFRLAGYSEERMLEVARSNVLALKEILRWNQDHGIEVFRITSNLIPFGSHPINSGSWKQGLKVDLERVGTFIRQSGMKVSMHPGQFTVLNTPNEEFLANTLRDLEYHASVLDLMGLDPGHKIVLHGGGAYGGKERSIRVLLDRIGMLPHEIRQRLVFENDSRTFHAEDILSVCREAGLPVVFDVLHHQVLPSLHGLDVREVILLFQTTWLGQRQEIHYSDPDPEKGRDAHSQSVDVARFGKFLGDVRDLELDVMLEVKDKQASVLKVKRAFPELG